MTLNVLLKLSDDVAPEPRNEVRTRVAACRDHGQAHIITTCRLNGITTDSEVAFYVNDGVRSSLGKGYFVAYRDLDSVSGLAILNSEPLYLGGRPANAVGFITLREMTLAAEGELLESLNGIIVADPPAVSNGKILNLPNVLARGQGSVQTYYRHRTS